MIYFFIALFLSISGTFAGDTDCNFVAIAYHDIVKTADQGSSDAVTESDLVAHFQWLKENGYKAVSIDDIYKAQSGEKPLPEKSVLLTFDDGYASFYTVVYPLLKAFNFPAVIAVVGSWIDAKEKNGKIMYGPQMITAENFMTWAQLKETVDSGLVDIASHTFKLHNEIIANPQGSSQAALVTRHYDMKTQQYESLESYKARVRKDLATNNDRIFAKTGQRPRVIVWPYGSYNKVAIDIAKSLGMNIAVTLDDEKYYNTTANLEAVDRCYYTTEETFASYVLRLENSKKHPKPALRAVRVDLDKIYDEDPNKVEQNLSKLIDRLYQYQISAVFIKVFSDTKTPGRAESLYFHNRHLPIKGDIFNRICWQIQSRVCWAVDAHSNTRVYAWIPITAFDFKDDYSSGAHALTARQKTLEIYEDLAFNNAIAGIVFDDSIPEDTEYWSPAGIIEFTKELTEKARVFRPTLKTVRSLAVSDTLDPLSEPWFAQTLQEYRSAYNYTSLMTLPSSSGLINFVDTVREIHKGFRKTIFEFQTVDWSNNDEPIDEKLILAQIRDLSSKGARNFSLYPDDFFTNLPEIAVVREAISMQQYPYLP